LLEQGRLRPLFLVEAVTTLDEPAHAQSVGDLLQALAGRRKHAPEEPALTQLCEP
jgi:hypothetical protein